MDGQTHRVKLTCAHCRETAPHELTYAGRISRPRGAAAGTMLAELRAVVRR